MVRGYGPWAVGSLLIAGATGVLLRFGMAQGFPLWAANFPAIRHAHSHLMYFGWVTLGLMALIWHLLPELTGRAHPRGVRLQMALTTGMALLSFPAFWANGYGTTAVAGRDLPLGSMAAGLNGLTWLLFMALYWRATRGLPARPLPVQLWDGALLLMGGAALGAAGIVGMIALDAQSALLQQVFLHLFLDLFGVGWFGLAVLGILWALVARSRPLPAHLPTGSLTLALMPTFMLGMTPMLVTPAMFWVAALANLLAAWYWAQHARALWAQRDLLPWIVRLGGVTLFGHLLIALLLLWPGLWTWSAGTQLRVFFLHNWLLGWVSSALIGALVWVAPPIAQAWLRPSLPALTGLWTAGVGGMLAALLGLGLLGRLPAWLLPSPLLLLQAAAWSSVLPVVVAVALLLALPVAYRLRGDDAALSGAQQKGQAQPLAQSHLALS